MKLTTFDLYGSEKTNNHGINTYHDVFFDGNELKFKEKVENRVSKFELSNILNNSDYKVCHNFYGYDGVKLPSLNNHMSNNIDTLLIDCLVSFNKTHHNLKKSIDNDPLEDAETTFRVLNKNFKRFHNYSSDLKSILFSLLIKYQEYNDFFIFYNQLTGNKLVEISDTEILDILNKLLVKNNISDKTSIDLVSNYIKSDHNSKLAIAFLVMFISNNTIVLPDFIFNENIELKNKLRGLLNSFYKHISKNLNDEIKIYLKDFSGFDSFRGETQIEGVKNGLENNDFLTILSTGGGKSLIYQLPAWIIGNKLGHLTLIITPLKALIKDQIDGLRDKQFNEVNYLSGDQNGIEKDIIYNKIKSGETKILFLTPEALRSEKILDLLQNRYISRVVVDEAHTLILWGQEFRPDYFFIKYFLEDIEKKNLNNKINITLLTATATVDVEKGILGYFNERNIKLIKAKEILKENIRGSVINIDKKEDKLETLVNKIKEIDVEKNPTIIFTGRIKSAIEIEKHLKDEGVNIRSFYAGMFLSDKKQVQEDFISGKLNVIVATKAFGMGIDKENVRYVIHYDLPGDIEDYTQEIGRAGRDGKHSQNIIFYEKKDIEERIKKLSYSGLRYYNIQNFLKYVSIKDKVVLSPRQIAIQSGIKTVNNNWVTDIKILLSFLENEEFDGVNILKRKYDNTFVLFNKIENKILNNCYAVLENDNLLNNEEKTLAKEIIYKIIEQKKAIDLNKLEENFIDDLGDDFEYRKVNINKVTNKIKSFKILSKSADNEETDIVVEAGQVIKDESFRSNIFNIFGKRVRNIDTFEESNSQSSFYDKIKNYYLFKNYITEKKGKVIIRDKNSLLEHYNLSSRESKIILDYIYTKDTDFNEKQSINLNELLLHLQRNYKNNYTISELKERLYFLDSLNIIKVKNGLLVFLTRFSIFFDENIINQPTSFKEKIQSEVFKKELINKLDIYKEVKINKLLALQNIVEILESKGIDEYTKLTEYYFNTALKEFKEKKMKH